MNMKSSTYVDLLPPTMFLMFMIFVCCQSTNSTAFSICSNNNVLQSSMKRYATSSSDLKERDDQFHETTNTTKMNRMYAKDGVVSRIKQAAIRASAAASIEQQQENIQLKNSFFSNYSPLTSKIETMQNAQPVVTLRQLTREIDSQLHQSRALPWEQYHQQNRFQNQRQHVSALARDSMAAIITHNYENDFLSSGWRLDTPTVRYEPNINMTTTTTQRSTAMSVATVRHVAIVLTKRSIARNGTHLLTVECSGRIHRLVHAMNHEKYVPDVVVFVGEQHSDVSYPIAACVSDDDYGRISDAELGYKYFMNSIHRSQSLLLRNLTNVTFRLEQLVPTSNPFANIATYIQNEHVVRWLTHAKGDVDAAAHAIALRNKGSSKPNQLHHQRRAKLHIQFALVSSDYHLCILNDIHVRSPGQSSLRYLDRWTTSSIMKNLTSANHNINNIEQNLPPSYFAGVQLETSWTYKYSTTATIHRQSIQTSMEQRAEHIENYNNDDSNIAIALFSSICYQRAQDLIPVLQNLRGVVANTEFFQRENYRVLVQARRSLVSGMERLYQQQPSLAAIHRIITPVQSSHDIPTLNPLNGMQNRDEGKVTHHQPTGKPLDVVLEGALLSLGRCLDLVRPAGLLIGSVPSHDFKLALMVLDQAVTQISQACDPDQPLPTSNYTNDFK